MITNQVALDHVLTKINDNLQFIGDNLEDTQNWNFKLKLKVQDIIDTYQNEEDNNGEESIRYIIKALSMLGYIKFSYGDYSIIEDVYEKCIQLILKRKYEINL